MLSTTRVVRDEAAPAAAAEVSPKISSIVDSVEKLTLLEVSELVQALKVSLLWSGCCREDGRDIAPEEEAETLRNKHGVEKRSPRCAFAVTAKSDRTRRKVQLQK